jgi:c-di-GMP-binding flagellar brake protein YcgR
MGVNKRRHYRTDGRSLGRIDVEVVAGGQGHKVTIIDISASGAAIAFSGMNPAEVETFLKSSMSSPQIVLKSGKLRNPLRLPFKPDHYTALPYGTGLGVSFRQQVRDSDKISRSLRRIFKRRQAVRVDCDLRRPMIVAICDADGMELCRAILKELSINGMGFLGHPGDAHWLKKEQNYTFRFILDGRELTLGGELKGDPKVAEMDARDGDYSFEVTRYGVEITERDRRRPSVSVPITSWVMRRQLEIRRAHIDNDQAAR